VNVDVPSPGAAPNVTYWFVPLKLSALFWAVAWAARTVETNARNHLDARAKPRILCCSLMIHLSAQDGTGPTATTRWSPLGLGAEGGKPGRSGEDRSSKRDLLGRQDPMEGV
jgi:hypothetical protein